MNTQEGTANAPRITEVPLQSCSGEQVEAPTQGRPVVGDSEEAEQFPKTQVDIAIFSSWVHRALDDNNRIVISLNNVVMPFRTARAVSQQLERQNRQLDKMQRVLDARKEELDAIWEGTSNE